MKTAQELNQIRNEVNKTVSAIKYNTDKLKGIQAKCEHPQVNNGRCNVCLRKFVNEDYLSKQSDKTDLPATTNFQFFLLTLILFFKGYTICTNSSLRTKDRCRWEKKATDIDTWVVQMKLDTTIKYFLLRENGEVMDSADFSFKTLFTKLK